MPTKTKKKEMNFIITDYDRKGNVIKVVIPIERQIALLERLNRLDRRS